MKRTIIAAAVLALGTAGAGVSLADPGPNGHNNFGLCTAYAHGSDNGQAHKHKAGPFQQLEQDADAAGNSDGTASPEEIASYCASQTPGGK